jgi:beta-lactamase regulating signal transducer with metallopeptidase domain
MGIFPPIRLGEEELWRLDLLLILGGIMALLWAAIVVLLYLVLQLLYMDRLDRKKSGNAVSDVRCDCDRSCKTKLK